jgi:hypothetical protein
MIELRYGQIHIGTITDEFLSDGTWFGRFQEAAVPDPSPLHERLHDYIAFSVEWHERLRSDLPADATEFDLFGEIISSGEWQMLALGCGVARLAEAPVFIQEEVTWTANPTAL